MRQAICRPASWLRTATIGAVLAVAGCTTGQGGAPAVSRPPVATPAEPLATSLRRYIVETSHLRARVHRDGPLARLGHNHVVTSTRLAGEIELAEPPAATRFTLRLPVDSLEVDLPAERAAAGTDFSAPVPEDDRAGTRRNMLAGALLDAERFPVLTIGSLYLGGGPEEWVARVLLTLRGGRHELEVPLRLSTLPDGLLQVEGHFIVDHAALGLVPFSVAMGALRVRPDIAIDFRLRAVPADRPPAGT